MGTIIAKGSNMITYNAHCLFAVYNKLERPIIIVTVGNVIRKGFELPQ